MDVGRVSVRIPKPSPDQRPVCFADDLARWYAALTSQERRRALGQFFTPVPVAEFMAWRSACHIGTARVLDPGGGTGILACAAVEHLATADPRPERIQIVAFEVSEALADVLEFVLAYLKRWLEPRSATVVEYKVRNVDFVLEEGPRVSESGNLFSKPSELFDIAIANPPYFKLGKSDPRSLASAHVVHGQPNIYALFLATAASMLREEGQLVCITPRSFASGPYFREFRRWFFRRMLLTSVHSFGSRKRAFERDRILQENVILSATRSSATARQESALVTMSSSVGVEDLDLASAHQVRLASILDARDWTLQIPDSDGAASVHLGAKTLEELGLGISTGPVVAFRAAAALCEGPERRGQIAPLLWMQNVRAMRVSWPVRARGKAQYIRVSTQTRSALLANRSYVLVRRFSAKEEKRRLVAAPLLAGTLAAELIGLENHLNYIHRPGGSLTEEEALGLAVLLNSSSLEKYLRTISGSTQINASDLRKVPLPAIEDIRAVGAFARRSLGALDAAVDADKIVEEVLG